MLLNPDGYVSAPEVPVNEFDIARIQQTITACQRFNADSREINFWRSQLWFDYARVRELRHHPSTNPTSGIYFQRHGVTIAKDAALEELGYEGGYFSSGISSDQLSPTGINQIHRASVAMSRYWGRMIAGRPSGDRLINLTIINSDVQRTKQTSDIYLKALSRSWIVKFLNVNTVGILDLTERIIAPPFVDPQSLFRAKRVNCEETQAIEDALKSKSRIPYEVDGKIIYTEGEADFNNRINFAYQRAIVSSLQKYFGNIDELSKMSAEAVREMLGKTSLLFVTHAGIMHRMFERHLHKVGNPEPNRVQNRSSYFASWPDIIDDLVHLGIMNLENDRYEEYDFIQYAKNNDILEIYQEDIMYLVELGRKLYNIDQNMLLIEGIKRDPHEKVSKQPFKSTRRAA